MKSWNAWTGAVLMQVHRTLQWSHDDEVVECNRSGGHGMTTAIGFNGATTMKSWNAVGNRARGTLRGISFNGATTMKSWNAWTLCSSSSTQE